MIAMRRCYAISIIGMEGKNMNHNKKKILKVTALFVFMFFLGWGAGSLQKQQMKKTVETVSVQNQADNWGLGFGAEGTQPTGNVTADELKKYNAWYVGDKNKKTIYLTFDCGYENGNTEPILDALKKHNAKATFFVVGHFLESAPDIVKRMEEEGHGYDNAVCDQITKTVKSAFDLLRVRETMVFPIVIVNIFDDISVKFLLGTDQRFDPSLKGKR